MNDKSIEKINYRDGAACFLCKWIKAVSGDGVNILVCQKFYEKVEPGKTCDYFEMDNMGV